MTQSRKAQVERETRETRIQVDLGLDGEGAVTVTTGLGFLDHMLTALAFHAGWDLELRAEGDLDVDDHHTVEDVAIVLGAALDRALGDRAGIVRFGHAYAPLDEALCRAVVDLSGRPHAAIRLGLERERLGAVATENLTHFFQSLAVRLRAALHVTVLEGENDHHRAEAAFKATALALRQAATLRGASAVDRAPDEAGVPSTKGTL